MTTREPPAAGLRILVIEPDDAIAEPLVQGLERHGFAVTKAGSGTKALMGQPPDLVILDLDAPGSTYLSRQLRTTWPAPIIAATESDCQLRQYSQTDVGVDDFVVKPFGFDELLARIRTVTQPSAEPSPLEPVQTLGPLVIDRRARSAWVDATQIDLNAKEFDFLSLLAEHPGLVVSRQTILQELRESHQYRTEMIDMHAASLRRKLGHPQWIETISKVGFRLSPATWKPSGA